MSRFLGILAQYRSQVTELFTSDSQKPPCACSTKRNVLCRTNSAKVSGGSMTVHPRSRTVRADMNGTIVGSVSCSFVRKLERHCHPAGFNHGDARTDVRDVPSLPRAKEQKPKSDYARNGIARLWY